MRYGRTAAVGVGLPEQHDWVAVGERGGDFLFAVLGEEVALGKEEEHRL